ncbi:MAG: hypothetical protein HRU19_04585 [Pseudobacteriovorax sp.]|nr:hypothetical protein [Pseudobacteriovorax sp.]
MSRFKIITLSLILFLGVAPGVFAQITLDVSIANETLRRDASNQKILKFNFDLQNLPLSDGASDPTDADIFRLVVTNLTVCRQNGCTEFFKWASVPSDIKNPIGDNIDDPDITISYQGSSITITQQRDYYSAEVEFDIIIDDEGGEFADNFSVYYQYRDSNRNLTNTIGITEAKPVTSQLEGVVANQSNLGVTISWNPISSVSFEGETNQGSPEGFRAYRIEVTEADGNAEPFTLSIVEASTETSPNCTLDTDFSTPEAPTCTFSCTAPGSLSKSLAENESRSESERSVEVQTITEGSVIGFSGLEDTNSYHAMIPQILPEGRLATVPATTDDGEATYTASCVIAQPGEFFTYAQLGGAGDPAQKDPNCFIATAAYGTPLHSRLDDLRWFRDRVIYQIPGGSYFVAAYYHFSPEIAQSIVFNEGAKSLVRGGLWLPTSMISWLRISPLSFFLTLVGVAGLAFLAFRKGRHKKAQSL